MTGKTTKLTQEEKDLKRREIDNLRTVQESKILGGYRMIYPVETIDKVEKYRKMIEIAKINFDDL